MSHCSIWRAEQKLVYSRAFPKSAGEDMAPSGGSADCGTPAPDSERPPETSGAEETHGSHGTLSVLHSR